jgi:hypothetical protein
MPKSNLAEYEHVLLGDGIFMLTQAVETVDTQKHHSRNCADLVVDMSINNFFCGCWETIASW